MIFLSRRYARPGSPSPAFYVVAVLAFAALAVWAVVRGDWLVASVAVAMIVVTAVGVRLRRGAIAELPDAPNEGDER